MQAAADSGDGYAGYNQLYASYLSSLSLSATTTLDSRFRGNDEVGAYAGIANTGWR
jgi:hypothetical protein